MSKNILIFLLSFLMLQAVAQDFTKVDQYARDYKAKTKDYKALAVDLTAPFDHPTDKARAIYVWLTDNIKYDCKKFHKRQKGKAKKKPITYRTEQEREQVLKARKVEYMTLTLKKKKGVCEDYALLFQKMCEAVGIESRFVTGHLGGKPQKIGKIPRIFNHAWNSVQLEGQWYLVDATTGSGTSKPGCKGFQKNFNGGLFMTAPQDMILSHYPDKEEWQYLEQPLTKEEYSQLPVASSGFYKYRVKDYAPKKGIINAKENAKIKFRIKFGAKMNGEMRLLVNGKFQKTPFRKTSDGYWELEYDLKKRRNKTMTIVLKDGQNVYNVLTYKSK